MSVHDIPKHALLTQTTYRVMGKFGKFGELSVIFQAKTIQISTYNNLLADILICQTFFCQRLVTTDLLNNS